MATTGNTNKSISQYLHFYIGCDVCREHSETRSKKFFEYAKLVGISKSEIEPDKMVVILDVGLDHFHEWYVEETKPILRKLSSMTEEEARELAIIYSGDNECKRVEGTASNWWYFQCFRKEDADHTLVISTTGEAWYRHYFDRDSSGHRNTVNHHEATRYLLSKGFDLYNLIDSGLALDKENK